MNQEVKNYSMQKMVPFLDNGQALRLEKVIEEVMLSEENQAPYEEDNDVLLDKFIASKKFEGRSLSTLEYYRFTIEKMIIGIPKNVRSITTEDLRLYLSDYQSNNNSSKVTILHLDMLRLNKVT